MKIKRIILTLICVPATLFGLLMLSGCPSGGPEPKTLRETLKGSTYILGSVDKDVASGTISVTSEFTGFLIAFNAEGNTATIKYNKCSSPIDVSVSYILDNNNINSSITLISSNSCFPSKDLSEIPNTNVVPAPTFTFKCKLPSSSIVITPGGKTSGADVFYTFKLVKK